MTSSPRFPPPQEHDALPTVKTARHDAKWRNRYRESCTLCSTCSFWPADWKRQMEPERRESKVKQDAHNENLLWLRLSHPEPVMQRRLFPQGCRPTFSSLCCAVCFDSGGPLKGEFRRFFKRMESRQLVSPISSIVFACFYLHTAVSRRENSTSSGENSSHVVLTSYSDLLLFLIFFFLNSKDEINHGSAVV